MPVRTMIRTTGVSSTTTVTQAVVKQKHQAPPNQNVFSDPMAVTWTEKYSDAIEKYWSKLPSFLASCLATTAIFILGATMSGEWILVAVHVGKQFGIFGNQNNTSVTEIWQNINLNGLEHFWIWSAAVSYIMYFGIGGFLHWYFYVQRRDSAKEWKCQPKKWLAPELERHEIVLGSFCLFLGSTLSAFLACHIYNGGWSMVYYHFDEYPWYWNILQWAVIFIYQDYFTYWHHRIYHTPFLYKHFHKLHHKYKQPTAFSVTAIHPVEFMHLQLMLSSPMFLFPIHWLPYSVIALYTYYHGILDHSGINFKSHWWQPWQPDAIFHDNHHQYFHVNFGFNIKYWDKLHGTYRRKDRFYREDIFYGHGKDIKDASAQELMEELKERNSENPLAFRGDRLEFELTEKDIAKQK